MSSITEEPDQRGHFTMKAVATATDQGTFTAVISTESIDREKDVVDAKAMVAALSKWNRPIPLAWNHSTEAEDIIGHVDPGSVEEVNGEVVASGEVDIESKQGQEAWRSFKSRTIGFSFGYMILHATKREGGGRHITELDVFEVTATPTPMNNDTRVLGWKSVETLTTELQSTREEVAELRSKLVEMEKKAEETDKEPQARSVDPLLERSRQAVAGIRLDGVPERKSPPKEPELKPEPPSEVELRDQFRDVTLQLLRGI